MQARIETLTERKLIGKRLTMSLANNKTFKLWQSFMPRRKEIKSNLTSELFCMQVYAPLFDFTFYNPNAEFEKWAAIEVANFEHVPNEMETYILTGGLYAVFDYKGLSTDTKIFQYIFGTWLPNSNNYLLDNRPHFEILGDKYKNNDPNSEEKIWIPIKPKEYR
ncbi:MAG: GyrI-like domain-containing protein [Chitinophagaceae bacterium]|nr:GyrI-like domain-containing protein [Chitinophagaceae bacterium]